MGNEQAPAVVPPLKSSTAFRGDSFKDGVQVRCVDSRDVLVVPIPRVVAKRLAPRPSFVLTRDRNRGLAKILSYGRPLKPAALEISALPLVTGL